MRLSTERILTTHVGSLPRPQDVVDLLFKQDKGEAYDTAQFDETMRRGVGDAVNKQAQAGIDIINDGEMAKIGYATYMRHRLTGFELGDVPRATPQDLDDYPEYRDKIAAAGDTPKYKRPICKGPIKVQNLTPLHEDIARLKDTLSRAKVAEGFMTAASPGTIAVFQPNEYYPSHEAYLQALAEAMREEYETIVKSGLILQIDCPDLAMGRHIRFRNADDDEFVRNAALQVEAMNHALANVPADRVRFHVCWGNYEGPHTRDIPLAKIVAVVLMAKPQAILLEAANPRHEHEWELWKSQKLPADKVLVPGVISSTNNYIEHPEVVAQRILRYADTIGRERVMAGSDCGYGTFAGFGKVHPLICWAKMRTLAEGAALATKKLWGKAGPAN
ncbi:MAG TPA: cobalamin-independent methionine synthase II family protein [Bryobacteraceae bacterium]|jgi:5-methyltetrahydropteroyltriglutamate--homocysteine methyltransferase|nr:cobalamin-independent methionine synthase II family protein [Bryobacteraceae bacterium]